MKRRLTISQTSTRNLEITLIKPSHLTEEEFNDAIDDAENDCKYDNAATFAAYIRSKYGVQYCDPKNSVVDSHIEITDEEEVEENV
ncbi:hypothetical protein [Priestia megaterium]|uniref:hypothetical protein n=1 Tax=Priestia megaterium TaxID=1404 RepID=UPI000CA1B017|nr:hypothetical protein [Priestia megaterium]AUO14759.1 hypothetical protein C0569_26085 [Priestia megaterium]